jgi:hypothetical protein
VKTPFSEARRFSNILDTHRKQGLSDAKIAEALLKDDDPFTTTDLRAVKSRAVNIQKRDQIRQAQSLKDKGMGPRRSQGRWI